MRGNTVRKQVFIYAGIALALAAAVVVWFVLTQWNVDRLFEQRDRVNVLLVGRDAADTVDLISLISFSETDAVLFSVPANLRLRDMSGSFAQAATLCSTDGMDAVADAIGTLIGLEIPFYISCARETIESWIDVLGGLTITLESSAIYMDLEAEPVLRVEIRAGDQLFDAAGAAVFATAPPMPDDMGLLKRQQAFLRAVLSQGIATPTIRSLRGTVREAAPALETNLSLADLQQVAAVLHDIPEEDVRANQLIGEIVEIDGVTYTQPNAVGTERVVAALLKGLELLTPSDVKVAVFNGNGVRSMASRTADYLIARGFQITDIANAYPFDYEESYVIVITDESKAWVLRDAILSDVRIVFPETFKSRYETLKDYVSADTDVVLIVGAGWEIE